MSTNRLNFDYTTEGMKQLDDLKKKLGVGSRAEVVRYAQGILNWAVQQAEQGNQVISVNSGAGTVKELSVPPLEEIRSQAIVRTTKRSRNSMNDVAGTIAARNGLAATKAVRPASPAARGLTRVTRR